MKAQELLFDILEQELDKLFLENVRINSLIEKLTPLTKDKHKLDLITLIWNNTIFGEIELNGVSMLQMTKAELKKIINSISK